MFMYHITESSFLLHLILLG